MKTIIPNINSGTFITKLAILLTLTAAGLVLVSMNGIIKNAIGILILGAMFAHAVELQHQCLHYTAFRARPANRIIGIILGLPMLTSYHAYRRSHLEHHKNLGTPNDIPFFTYRFIESGSLGAFLFDLFGIGHLKSSLSAIVGNNDARLIEIPGAAETSRISERFDYGLMGFLLACSVLYSMGFDSVYLIKAWVLPLILVAQPIHFLVELPEHIGCTINSTDPHKNTRTIIGSRFSQWFTNFNNLHVEHHLLPSLSMDQMPMLFSEQHGNHAFLCSTYPAFYLSLFKMIRTTSSHAVLDRSARRPA